MCDKKRNLVGFGFVKRQRNCFIRTGSGNVLFIYPILIVHHTLMKTNIEFLVFFLSNESEEINNTLGV